MNFELKSLGLVGVASEKCDVLVVLVSQSFKAAKDDLSSLLAQTLKSADLEAKVGKLLHLYRPTECSATRVVLAGVGEGSAKEVRTAVTIAMVGVKSPSMKKLVVAFASPAREDAVRAAVQAVADATYVYTHTKSKPDPRCVSKVSVTTSNAAEVRATFDRAVAIVAGCEVAKEWANRPANYATPTHLGQAAQELSSAPKFSCEVLGPKEVAKLGMGSFMAVAQGSEQPLRFIVLRYGGAAKTKAPTVLVGKGITFDSGGISIKSAGEMDEMKFDMSGAASVLGVFRALALLKPTINVVGLIASCENMISGKAVKPGDVVTSLSGQTIEILNTDAEGRLVLCDALTYAERFKPALVVDVATLTGACVVALGHHHSGLFTADDAMATQFQAAAEASLDPCWRMPLDEEYDEALKSNFADMGNVGPRGGGAITAAMFLRRFTGKYRWAHLDIAGTAWKSGVAKGATGRPVGLLTHFVLAQVG